MLMIRVPATTANLGPGFDCLGMALSLYADISFEVQEKGLLITGCPPAYANENNLVYRAFCHGANALGKAVPGLHIHMNSSIPPARGLGSSAACVAAGVMAAGKLLHGPFTQEELLRLSTQLEGHPDNAAAAIYGGIRVSAMAHGQVLSLPVHPDPGLKLLALVPSFPLETAKARQVLPGMVSREDAVFNLSRTALVIKAIETGAFELLAAACEDRLHQPWRFPLIEDGETLAGLARAQGADACVISGAGPSLMCFTHDPGFPARMTETLARFPAWQALALNVAAGITEMRT